jgi:hypothetical protein
MTISATNTPREPSSGIPFAFQELVVGAPEGRIGTALDTDGTNIGEERDDFDGFTN